MKYKNYEFRIKQMNAIEVLAMRSQIDFSTYESALYLYKLILEHMEVCVNDKWIPVKTKDYESYTPNDILNDVEGIDKIVKFFTDYIKSVFQKSNK